MGKVLETVVSRINSCFHDSWKLIKNYRFGTIFLVIVLCFYLIAGFYTVLHLIIDKIPNLLFEDFMIYQKAVELTFRGLDTFKTTGRDTNFFYPPPSLLVVEVFSHIKPFLLKVATYTTVNILLVMLLVRGVARKYEFSFKDTWYWYVLCLGFAPFLELLTIGQINILTLFGIFLLFLWENKYPLLAGMGLALAIITKVTPILLFGYLLFSQKFKVILITFIGILILTGVTALRYGLSPLILYPEAFRDLADTFVLDKNSQSLVAKLVTLARVSESSPLSTYISQNYEIIQTLLMVYLVVLIGISVLIMFLGKQSIESSFIITVFAMMLSPNVMWYHHYVFALLPMLIWMGWKRLDKRVVAWCLLGFFIIQLDRWNPPYGLWIHLFFHISMLAIIVWQIRDFRIQTKGDIFVFLRKGTPEELLPAE